VLGTIQGSVCWIPLEPRFDSRRVKSCILNAGSLAYTSGCSLPPSLLSFTTKYHSATQPAALPCLTPATQGLSLPSAPAKLVLAMIVRWGRTLCDKMARKDTISSDSTFWSSTSLLEVHFQRLLYTSFDSNSKHGQG
jgi:hypothetical protein